MTLAVMSDDAPIELFVAPTVEAFATVSLPADPLFHARLREGAAVEGLVVELAGDALGGLEIEALEVWVPYGDAAARWEVAAQGEGSDAMRFTLPTVVLEAPATRLEAEELRALPIESIEARLVEENRRSLAGSFRGRAQEALEASLRIRVRGEDPAGPASVWREIVVMIDPLPRRPILPSGARLDVGGGDTDLGGSREDVATWALCDAHGGSDYVVAWFAFDALDVLGEDVFRDWVDRLITAVLDGVDQPFLLSSILRPGARGEGSKPAVAIADRDGISGPSWAESWSSLRAGAVLRLDVAQDGHDPAAGYLLVRNSQLGDPLAVVGAPIEPPPLEILAVLPQPHQDRVCDGLMRDLRAVLDEVVSHEACVGALVTAQGAPQAPDTLLPYELLAGLTDVPLREAVYRRPRVPAWRVWVPPAAAQGIVDSPLVRRRSVRAGWLVGSEAEDPFSMDDEDRDALERALAACFRSSAG